MSWPLGWVALTSPLVDKVDPTLGDLAGVIPCHSYDPNCPDIPPDPTTNYNCGLRPICIPVPWPYDDAGIAFPPGSMLVMAGLGENDETGVTLRPGAGTGTINMGISGFWYQKNLWPVRVIVNGLLPGTVGSVKLGHNSDYGNTNPPASIDHEFDFNGDDGPNQIKTLDTVLSIPSGEDTSWVGHVFVAFDTWSGTPPTSVTVYYRPNGVVYGRVVPGTLPGGYTARNDADDHRGGTWGPINQRYKAGRPTRPGSGQHPANARFLVAQAKILGQFETGVVNNITPGMGFRFGSPDVWANTPVTPVAPSDYPAVWIGNTLVNIEYQSRCYGASITAGIEQQVNGSADTPGPHTASSGTGVPGGPNDTAWGPGLRNIRCFIISDYQAVGARPTTFVSIVARVYFNAVLFTSHTYTGPNTNGNHFDILNVYPITAADGLKCEVIYDLNVTMGAAGGGVSTDFSVHMTTKFSPRCDIPLPFTVVGPNNEVAPGGYLPALVGSPPFAGVAPVHNAAGVMSCVLPAYYVNTNVKGSFAATFLPPRTGVWKISSTPNGSGGFPGPLTLGEFEFRLSRRNSALGRANRRFWGHIPAFGTDVPVTWTLEPISPTVTPVPSGGMVIGAGHLTDSHWFFGTLALPAAGTYRVTAGCFAGSTLLIALSETDPYVADYLEGPHNVYNGPVSGSATTIEVMITVNAAKTVYLRFEAYDPYYRPGSFIGSPLEGGANGNIAWAAV